MEENVENVENVVEETTQETQEQVTEEQKPEIDESKFDSAGDDSVTKVDLSKPPVSEEVEKEKSDTEEKAIEEVVEDKVEETVSEKEEKEDVVLEEITNEEVEEVQEQIEEAVAEAEATGKPIPENIQKLMDFMEETGGDLEDYVKLNQNYDNLDETALLKEYYKQTKPHLNDEEINFLMEDSFSYDEEIDDERDIKRKKLALKEQVASAKSHLDGQKSKYYEDIKAGSKLTPEQQKAMDFFNRYNKESEEFKQKTDHSTKIFEQKTTQLFKNKFKGFEYNVGDKKYRFNIKNPEEVMNTQSDINNFMAKFVDENSVLNDAKGYHRSLFTAMNADAVANHFYEQGRADAIKESVSKAKNVNMNPRQSHGQVEAGGIKVKVLGENSSDFKFKINKNK